MGGEASHLAERTTALHAKLREADPFLLADHTGAVYLPANIWQGTFYLPFWGREATLTFPEFIGRDGRTGERFGTFEQALMAYYFTLADGTPLTRQWVSFSELPDGQFYAQAFQGYTGHELCKVFGGDGSGFAAAATSLKCYRPALSQPLGDQAFAFQVFPHVCLMAVCWLGDEEIPASYRILFDASVCHHLSTDACAILGSMLTRFLLQAYHGQNQQGRE
ncbi:MAG: DUF3786 domain-containing protein [Candidatus Promineifilaceae bacterium]